MSLLRFSMMADQIDVNQSFFLSLRKSIFANAKRLLFDSEKLFKEGSFPSAAFLAITSIEEIGKLYDVLIAHHKINKGKFNIKEFYDRFRNHKMKHLSSFTKAIQSTKISKKISRLWELIADNRLMTIRNNCLYEDVDILKEIISSPSATLSRDEAYYFIETAYEVLLSQLDSAFGHFSIDTTQDVDRNTFEKEFSILSARLSNFINEHNYE